MRISMASRRRTDDNDDNMEMPAGQL
jgi:hypothetical protein